MARDIDDDRPRRSWRDIDKRRDSGSRRRSADELAQERLSRSPVYEQYKAQVSRMFSGGELPDVLKEKLEPTGEDKARNDLLKRARALASDDRKAWSEVVTRFVSAHTMPDDVFLLTEWLDHPKDLVLAKVLVHLNKLVDEGVLAGAKAPKSLSPRLRALELGADEPDRQAQAKALRERLEE